MKYISTANPLINTNFEEAVFKGLPDSKGLYMPAKIPPPIGGICILINTFTSRLNMPG